MKKGLVLDKVVLLGRTFQEYALYLGLESDHLRGKKIVDIGAGVSSFCAEATGQGLEVVAVDPIYQLSSETIRARCEPDLERITRSIHGLSVYRWSFYKNPQGMRRFRERAYKKFLRHYRSEKGTRYLPGQLPKLPFSHGAFDVALVSYLLFLYDEHLGYAFHRDAIRELMRITRGEARVYPMVNFEAERSEFVGRLQRDPALAQFRFQAVEVDFEFLANSNAYLKITHR